MKTIAIAIMLILCHGAMGFSQTSSPAPAEQPAGNKQPAGVNPKGILTKEDFKKVLLANQYKWAHPNHPKDKKAAVRFLANGTCAVDFEDIGRWDIVDLSTVRVFHKKGNFTSTFKFNADFTEFHVTQTSKRLFEFDCPLIVSQ